MTKPKARSSLKPTKKKLHTRTQCLQLAQKLCKLKMLSEYGRIWCMSCGQPLEMGTTSCQGGHLINRQERATETEPDNLWPQCYACNVLKNGNTILYRYNLIKTIGEERVLRLERMAMAKRGDEEAYELLSPIDRQKVRMKKSANYYDGLYYELNEQIKSLEKELKK